MKLKNLIYFTSIVYFSIFNQLKCAEQAPTFEHTVNRNPETSQVTLTNASGHNLWVSVKIGGAFDKYPGTFTGMQSCSRKSEGTIILESPFIGNGESRTFNIYKDQSFTLRIFENAYDHLRYHNSKFAMRFKPFAILRPRTIIINFSDLNEYQITESSSFVGLECTFCHATINPRDIVAIPTPCKHILHLPCLRQLLERTQDPATYLVRQGNCVECHSTIEKYYHFDASTGNSIDV